MAEQMRPASKEQAPDPSHTYERSHPSREAGMGRMTNNAATPSDSPDGGKVAVGNAQEPTRQVNAQDDAASRRPSQQQQQPQQQQQQHQPGKLQGLPPQPDHSMKDEEPLGWDQAPTDEHDPERQRHPRTEGKGGVD